MSTRPPPSIPAGRPAPSARFAGLLLLLSLLSLTAGCGSLLTSEVHYELAQTPAVRDPQFLQTMSFVVGPAMVASNRVTALQNGDQIFPAMLSAIAGARRSVCLESYIFWSGRIGRQFTDALAERARAGVRVHILLDWFGVGDIDRDYLDELRLAGAEVEKYNPLVWYKLGRVNHRDHRKLLIVDGQVGFTGGAGIGDLWAGGGEAPDQWRDQQFRVEGPAVAQMQGVFFESWRKTSRRVLTGEDYFPPLGPAGDMAAHLVASTPREGVEDIRLLYLLAIAGARQHIRISSAYFVPGSQLMDALVDARRRGVDVEIIVPGRHTDHDFVRDASRSTWGRLLRAGVKFYEYEPAMYHCKVIIIDDVWVSVGSANFDSRSFRLNDEANLNIYSEAFAATQTGWFEADKQRSRLITHEEWRNRSLWRRFMELITVPFHSQL